MAYEVTIFGIDLTIKPVAFSLSLFGNKWDVYWYGIIIATGFLLAILYGAKNAKRFNIDKDKMLDVVLVAAPVALFCARLYYVIFDGEKCESLADFIGIGSNSGVAGIAIYGAVIGAFVSGALMCRLKKIKIADMFDLASLGFLIGQGIGRWGNFINQEAYGSFTGSSFWGMESNKTIAEMGEGLVHPCFLYESVWCIVGFFIIHTLSKKRKFSGEMFLMYCAWYGFGRGFIEILRTDSLMLGSIKVSCLLAFLLCVASVCAIIIIRKKLKPEAEYISVFSENMEDNNETD
ncbi:MAG: prolipoprotein diacylglyceryl transferase [Ruminococcaceae bacterium]|nr:prolipoprotein diacylglyceryl transferase [Oscillospiraceae bacterium]